MLWSEDPFVRLQLLNVSGREHLMSEEDKAIWRYLFAQPELRTKEAT